MSPQPKRDPRALNAYRHGLTGQVHFQNPAERAAYEHHCQAIRDSLAPVGEMEIQLAQTIAASQWQLNRAKVIEDTIFSLGIANCTQEGLDNDPDAFTAVAMAQTWLKGSKHLALLNLYAHRIENSIHKNLRLLRQLQQDRKAALQKAAEEINLLAELPESEADPHQPPPTPGFVFSTTEIATLATHLRRLNEAKLCKPTLPKAA